MKTYIFSLFLLLICASCQRIKYQKLPCHVKQHLQIDTLNLKINKTYIFADDTVKISIDTKVKPSKTSVIVGFSSLQPFAYIGLIKKRNNCGEKGIYEQAQGIIPPGQDFIIENFYLHQTATPTYFSMDFDRCIDSFQYDLGIYAGIDILKLRANSMQSLSSTVKNNTCVNLRDNNFSQYANNAYDISILSSNKNKEEIIVELRRYRK